MKKVVILAVGTLLLLSGCMWQLGTPSGYREIHRGMNGLVVTGKSKPNVADEYHKTQRATDATSLEALERKLELLGASEGGS
jgi:hypothetical protein